MCYHFDANRLNVAQVAYILAWITFWRPITRTTGIGPSMVPFARKTVPGLRLHASSPSRAPSWRSRRAGRGPTWLRQVEELSLHLEGRGVGSTGVAAHGEGQV